MVSVVLSVVCVVVAVIVVVACVCPCVHSTRFPSVRSLRPRVCRHHANMCFNMCAWVLVHTGTYGVDTRRREGIIVSSAHQNLPAWRYHVLQRFTISNHWILHVFNF